MSDIKLFRLTQGHASELQGDASDLEKPLQTLIENNLDPLLGIRFLASEHSTGKTHAGRIDTLGLDEHRVTGSASHFFNFYTNLEMQLGVKSINYNLRGQALHFSSEKWIENVKCVGVMLCDLRWADWK